MKAANFIASILIDVWKVIRTLFSYVNKGIIITVWVGIYSYVCGHILVKYFDILKPDISQLGMIVGKLITGLIGNICVFYAAIIIVCCLLVIVWIIDGSYRYIKRKWVDS